MKNNQALTSLLDRVSASGKPVSIGFDELQEWQPGVLELLVKTGLMVKDVQAQSLACTGCEHGCFMPIVLSEGGERAFIVCDHHDKQSEMGRIAVSFPRLQQWKVSARQVAVLVARLLRLEGKPEYRKKSTSYELGLLKSEQGRRWAILTSQPLALSINQQSVPVSDLLYFEDGVLVIDRLRVDDLLNAPPNNNGKPYTPDTSKQAARKLATQAMYQNWRDEYQKLKRQHPQKSDTWHSIQLAKLEVAQGKSSETIRKNMKL